MEDEIFENLLQVLWEYGNEVKRIYQMRLEQDGHRATGKLIDNQQVFVNYQGTDFLVTLQLEDYFRYVELGRFPYGDEDAGPGKLPPVSKILEWVKVKNILPIPKNGKLPTQEQLAWAISKKIEKVGIKPGRQLAETVEALNRQYIPLIQEAVQKDFDKYAIYVLKDIDKMIRI